MSHLWAPLGSRRRLERSFPTSVMSLYSKFDGHDDTVSIHSLSEYYQQLHLRTSSIMQLLFDQSNNAYTNSGSLKNLELMHMLRYTECCFINNVTQHPRLKNNSSYQR